MTTDPNQNAAVEACNLGREDFFELRGKRTIAYNVQADYIRGYDEAQANWQRRFARHTLVEGQTMPPIEPKKQLTVREVLSVIEECLAHNTNISRDLWRVLTALRGPDAGSESLKKSTTAIIRDKAFPGLMAGKGNRIEYVNGAMFAKDTEIRAKLRKKENGVFTTNSHFINHAIKAFRALGMKWDENNIKE